MDGNEQGGQGEVCQAAEWQVQSCGQTACGFAGRGGGADSQSRARGGTRLGRGSGGRQELSPTGLMSYPLVGSSGENEAGIWPAPIFPGYDFFFLFFFFFLGLLLWHIEVPRLGVKSELQLPATATATATATPDPNHACNLHHSSQQHWILNPLCKVRNRTLILMDPSQVGYQ